MNQFTKEELESIANCIWVYQDLSDTGTYSDLLKKVQSIIDNYCEHDWSVGFGSIYSPVIYCKKCFGQKPLLPDEIFNKVMGMNHENQ
jgi:predicted RNA-binding protein with EMAP domain